MLSLLFTPVPAASRKFETGRISSGITAVANALHRWYRRRITIRALEGLDDRTLKDIGVDRSEIASAVYFGRETKRNLFNYDIYLGGR